MIGLVVRMNGGRGSMTSRSTHNPPLRRWLALAAALVVALVEVAFATHELDHVHAPCADSIEAVCAVCDLEASTNAPLRSSPLGGFETPLPLASDRLSETGADANCGILPADPAAPRAPPLHS